jgi:hypothetical protein
LLFKHELLAKSPDLSKDEIKGKWDAVTEENKEEFKVRAAEGRERFHAKKGT